MSCKFIKIVLFVWVACFFKTISYAQTNNVTDDFKKLYHHYQSMKSYSMNFEIEYINDRSDLLFRQEGRVVHSEHIHYTKVASNISLTRKNEFISLNSENRFMVYNKTTGKTGDAEDSAPSDIGSLIDSLYAKNENFKYAYIGTKKGEVRLHITDLKSTSYDAYEVVLDSKSHKLLQYTYYLKEGSQNDLSEIRIKYIDEKRNPKLNSPELKLNYYIKGAPGNLKPAENFQGFELIDQTQK